MKLSKQILFSVLVTLLTIVSCKPDKLLPIDPCKEFNDGGGIGFKILENPAGDNEYETDTIFLGNPVIFKANDIYTRVEWKIAYDPRVFTNKKQSLRFTQLPTALLPVTMIGYRKAYLECVPNDDGIDTVTKYFFLVNGYQIKVVGKYFGRFDINTADTSTIKIAWESFGPDPNFDDYLVLRNFPRNNCGTHPYQTGIRLGALGYRFFDKSGGFTVSGLPPCDYPVAGESPDYIKGMVKVGDSLIIDFKTTQTGSVQKWYKWRGKKIP